MTDQTEDIRRVMVAGINSQVKSDSERFERMRLEDRFGAENVWDTDQLRRDFEVLGFMAPFCVVKRKSDGAKGSIMFQHSPRFYFDFQKD